MTQLNLPYDWLRYSEACWSIRGKPKGLNPSLIFNEPLNYDQAAYNWLENKYSKHFYKFFSDLNKPQYLFKNLPSHFIQTWQEYYDRTTLWKQIIPFFVFLDALSKISDEHIKLAQLFSIGQGIPSVVVDNILDSNNYDDKNNYINEALFSLSAYSYSLAEITKMNLDKKVIEIFLEHTREMYLLMWQEWKERFQIPDNLSDQFLDSYLNGNSRLLSSVFFSISIEWAFKLSNINLNEDLLDSAILLRKVRQLNDEIADFDEDIISGIITYPYLIGLANNIISDDLTNIIMQIWHNGQKYNSYNHSTAINKIWNLLYISGCFEKAALDSMKLLKKVMNTISLNIRPEKAFEVTIIVNLRIARLFRLKKNNWREIPREKIYQPRTTYNENITI